MTVSGDQLSEPIPGSPAVAMATLYIISFDYSAMLPQVVFEFIL